MGKESLLKKSKRMEETHLKLFCSLLSSGLQLDDAFARFCSTVPE